MSGLAGLEPAAEARPAAPALIRARLARPDDVLACLARPAAEQALGALSPADGRGVGIARYVRDADDPQAAEIAVTMAGLLRNAGADLTGGGYGTVEYQVSLTPDEYSLDW